MPGQGPNTQCTKARGGRRILLLHTIPIEDTFAEAFPMTAARLIVTAETPAWAQTAGQVATGYAASVIGCDAEAGIERTLPPEETPDGRPGVSLLLFAFSRDALQKAVVNRVGQCILTCPTTACYNGLPHRVKDKTIRVGGNLRFFGDGFQFSKKLEGRRYWRMPVMDGEFTCEDFFGTVKGVAGGNFLIVGASQAAALAAAEAAVAAIRPGPGVILPFPGGVVRSGSKVGSRYKKLRASTNDAYCPTPARPGEVCPARGGQRRVRDRHRRRGPAGRGRGDSRRRACGLPAGRVADHGRQLRRQAGAVSSASAQVAGDVIWWGHVSNVATLSSSCAGICKKATLETRPHNLEHSCCG